MKKLIKLPLSNSKNKTILILVWTILITGSFFWYNARINCKDCAYDKEGIKITNPELSDAIKSREIFYKYNKQEVDSETLKNDVLKQLKDEKKIANFAKDNNIKVTEQEIDALYKERVKQNGDEDALLKKVNDLYGFTKKQYFEVLKKDVLREKVQEKLGAPIADWLNK